MERQVYPILSQRKKRTGIYFSFMPHSNFSYHEITLYVSQTFCRFHFCYIHRPYVFKTSVLVELTCSPSGNPSQRPTLDQIPSKRYAFQSYATSKNQLGKKTEKNKKKHREITRSVLITMQRGSISGVLLSRILWRS